MAKKLCPTTIAWICAAPIHLGGDLNTTAGHRGDFWSVQRLIVAYREKLAITCRDALMRIVCCMAPTIPSSLSPHICILTSPDLNELLENSSLPSLPRILQSFSPLPQVTTRTTSLTPVPHTSFALRFSDLQDVEEACREDEDQRAIRTIDSMTARISKRCARWVQDMDAAGEQEGVRTPWWDELRRCAEGDFVPGKLEAWNHPVAPRCLV
ncbi:hypothetical protein M413DRAFT_212220 [Hebeloma cylindrosporum]|uniref:Uncharacterized protein n=1 Tax=Hebeloma cylindrosporum TaxID=76867 RepID=A0A0C3CUR4_HEBCY|nr:hypothetical protein M413DRAFT_212220 [Hebeloma cylindrosporum h7]